MNDPYYQFMINTIKFFHDVFLEKLCRGRLFQRGLLQLRLLQPLIGYYFLSYLWFMKCTTVKLFNSNRLYFNTLNGYINSIRIYMYLYHCTKSFPLTISSVNVTKSAGNCGFGHVC